MPNQDPRQFTYTRLQDKSGRDFLVILVAEEEALKPSGIDWLRSFFADVPTPIVFATLPVGLESDESFQFFGEASLRELARSRINMQTEWLEESLPPLHPGDSMN